MPSRDTLSTTFLTLNLKIFPQEEFNISGDKHFSTSSNKALQIPVWMKQLNESMAKVTLLFLYNSLMDLPKKHDLSSLRSAAAPLNTILHLEKMESPVELPQRMEKLDLFLINLQIRLFINEDC